MSKAERGIGDWYPGMREELLRLEGELCPNPECPNRRIFPKRDVCPSCGTDTYTGERLREIERPKIPANWGVNKSCQDGGP
jgi:hypothetical protein